MRYMVSLHPWSINGCGRVHTVPTNVPGGLGYTYPNPIQLKDKLWLFWRGGDWNPTFSYSEDGSNWIPARELVRFAQVAPAVREVRRRQHDEDPRDLLQRPVHSLKNSLYYVRYEGSNLFAASGGRSRRLGDVPVDVTSSTRLPVLRQWRPGVGHDIALTPRAGRASSTRAGSAAATAATRSSTRTTTAEVDQPQDRRGGQRAPVVHLGRRDVRPRGSALRLPLADDRPLEPGRAVVHARRRPHVDDGAPHRLPGPLRDPARDAARAARRQPGPVLEAATRRTKGYTNYRSRIHALDF